MLDSNSQMFQRPSMNGDNQGWTYKSSNSFGINSKSEVQKEAWEFLKFMISEEVQSSESLLGIPVHKNAYKTVLQEAAEKLKPTISDEKLLNERIDYAANILDAAHPNFSIDKNIESIVQEEFESYRSGQKSVDEVSKLIQNRVMTYLNE